jgi:hypothetical protein
MTNARSAALLQRHAETSAVMLARVRGVFEAQTGQWLGLRAVTDELGIAKATAWKRVQQLAAAGQLEHNGKGGAWSRYRTRPTPDTIVVLPRVTPRKRTVHGVADQQTHDDLRRQDIETRVLAACADYPMTPRGVAVELLRNAAEIRQVMHELVHRGRLITRDGYHTFEAVTR